MKQIIHFQRENCKNCYKCIRHCPVKAIRIIDQQAQIIESQCIFCENCTLVCPQNAKEESNSFQEINQQFRKGKKLIASFHPAYCAMYQGEELRSMVQKMKALGFEEVRFAMEAKPLIKEAYERVIKERSDNTSDKKLLISGNCSVVVQLIRKQYPELLHYLSPVISVMEAHAHMLKAEDEDAVVVAVSPCISLMAEMEEKENAIDYVVTFQELEKWIEQKEYSIRHCDMEGLLEENWEIPRAKGFSLPGGVSKQLHKKENVHYIHSEGLNTCKKILSEIEGGEINADDGGLIFLELSACPNGCLGGPAFAQVKVPLLKTKLMLLEAATKEEENVGIAKEPQIHSLPSRCYEFEDSTEMQKKIPDYSIRSVLAKMGKTSPKDELNCGGCGYRSCREMAIAILLGKAEPDMCLPYMREREESYSDKIVNAMPGLLVTVDYKLHVLHANQAASDLFDPYREGILIGEPVGTLMDDYSLVEMISFDKHIVQDQVVLPGGRILDRVLTNDKKSKQILCVMKDITLEKKRQDELLRQRQEAVELADKLMADQLKIVHDIAGYLGETAADTKIAIEELKRTILQEKE